MVVGGQRHAPAAYPRERPGTPPGFDPRTVQPVAQSLYRLSYPGPLKQRPVRTKYDWDAPRMSETVATKKSC